MFGTETHALISVVSIISVLSLLVTGILASREQSGDRLEVVMSGFFFTAIAIATAGLFTSVIFAVGDVLDSAADMEERREAHDALIVGVEDRYDIDVQNDPYLDVPGDWKIDGEWRRCVLPDIESNPDQASLKCDPSTGTQAYVDYDDLVQSPGSAK